MLASDRLVAGHDEKQRRRGIWASLKGSEERVHHSGAERNVDGVERNLVVEEGRPTAESGVDRTVSMLPGDSHPTPPSSASPERLQVRRVNHEPPNTDGRSEPLQTVPEFERIVSGQDQHGLAHPHNSWAMDETGLVVRGGPAVLCRRVLATEDQAAHLNGGCPVAAIDIIG